MKEFKRILAVCALFAMVFTVVSCNSSKDSSPSSSKRVIDAPVTIKNWSDISADDQSEKIVVEHMMARIDVDGATEQQYCTVAPGDYMTLTGVVTEDDARADVNANTTDMAYYRFDYSAQAVGLMGATPSPIETPICEDGVAVIFGGTLSGTEDAVTYRRIVDQSKQAYAVPVENPVTRMVGINTLNSVDKRLLYASMRNVKKTEAPGRYELKVGDLLTPLATSKKGDVTVVRLETYGGDGDIADLLMSTDLLKELDGAYQRVLDSARSKDNQAPLDSRLVTHPIAVMAGPQVNGEQCYLQPDGVGEVREVNEYYVALRYLAPPNANTAKACADDSIVVIKASQWYEPKVIAPIEGAVE